MPAPWPMVVACLFWTPSLLLARWAAKQDRMTEYSVPPSPEVLRYQAQANAAREDPL